MAVYNENWGHSDGQAPELNSTGKNPCSQISLGQNFKWIDMLKRSNSILLSQRMQNVSQKKRKRKKNMAATQWIQKHIISHRFNFSQLSANIASSEINFSE